MPTDSSDVCLPLSDDLRKETMTTIVTINIVALVGVISVFGIACNVIIILVFCKQGFSETTNISYTALAISNLLSLAATLCLSIFWNPWFLNSELPLVFIDIQMAFASLPYTCFSNITGMLTAFATFERCLCVVWPLKVKRILTSTVTIIFIVSIYLMICLTMVPMYSTLTLGWRSEPWTNKTLLGVTFAENTELIANTSYILHSALQLVAFFAVLLFTVTLIVCLRQMTAWRIQQSKTQNGAKKSTKRQDKAIKMVSLIAATYVATYLPTIIGLIVTVPYPSFGPTSRYKNIFYAVWSISILFSVVNSSANLFVFYVMSSKFRLTCYQMLSLLLQSTIMNCKDKTTGASGNQ